MAERVRQPGAGGWGHRSRSHPDDVWIEAWAPTREQCVAEAVLAVVDTFADTSDTRPVLTVPFEVAAASDEDVLAEVLDEVVALVEDAGQVPIDAEVEDADGGLDVRFTVADLTEVDLTGPVPLGVSPDGLQFGRGSDAAGGWHCQAVLDV